MMKRVLIEKACKVKILLLDVDGVMTDGSLYFDNQGNEIKVFNIHDGHGIKRLRESGIRVAILSGRTSPAVGTRARELSIDEVDQVVSDKLKVSETLLRKLKLRDEEAALIGDDLPDLPVLKRVGFSISVFNGVDEVKDPGDWVTRRPGGRGAVREAADFILSSRGREKDARVPGFYKG